MLTPNDKKFDRACHKEFDGPGKKTAASWMIQMGFKNISDNLGESNGNFERIWDLCGYTDQGDQMRLEVSVKKDWGTVWRADRWTKKPYPFPWPTMDYELRKRNKTGEHATHHLTVGGDHRRVFFIERSLILAAPQSYKPCRNRAPGDIEPFFNVALPSPRSAWYELENDKWVQKGR